MCPKGGGRGRGAAARPFASHTFLSMAHTPTTIALVRSVVDASSMKDAEALRRRPTCEPAWIPAPLPSPRTYSAPGVVGTLAGSLLVALVLMGAVVWQVRRRKRRWSQETLDHVNLKVSS